jgi:hypothetical protein
MLTDEIECRLAALRFCNLDELAYISAPNEKLSAAPLLPEERVETLLEREAAG